MADKAKKILIVEDEKAIAKALKLKLEHEGYEAIVNGSGVGIIDVIKKENPALILLDLVMPKVDGFAVLEKLKEEKIRIPVIVLSNLSQEEDEKKAKALGAKEFFVKSNVLLNDVVDHVAKIV